jgi:hypothetical protein
MSAVLTTIAKFLARPAVVEYLIRRAKRTPYVHITGPDGSIYMERYWLFNPYPASSSGAAKNRFPISIRLHRIMRPDGDRHLHDHPWNARTFILRGGYTEVRPRRHCGMSNWSDTYPVKREAGETAALKFGEYHRITSVSDGGVWTLFVTGKYRGTWGFDVDGVKKPWREYLGIGE